jgi:uncharacterized membrane protein
MNRMTTLGLDERLERVLAYAFGWVSGIILFLLEKNRAVRWHAVQSMVTFGTLSLVMLIVSLLRLYLGWIPLIGLIANAGLGLLLSVLWWVTIGLWLWLMLMAWFQPNYRLPIIGDLISNWVESSSSNNRLRR